MFDKILIANRGEIAVRIIRACREMGIKTVAVFSEPDREALHTQLADEAVCIGSAKAADSYINMPNIITAAVETKAQAIHPGFGFLSENSTFAAMCEECNIKFIGPAPSVIDALGNKSNAREMMIRAGVPVIREAMVLLLTESRRTRWQESWDIRLWSRHLPAVAARESASCVLKMNWIRHLRQHKARRKQLLVTIRCIWKK